MSKTNIFRKLGLFLLDLVFPITCFGCDKDGVYLCPNCEQNLRLETKFICPICRKLSFCGQTCQTCHSKTALNGLVYIAPYHNKLIQKMIHSFKYEFVKDLATPLGLLIAKTIMESELQNLFSFPVEWLIVPIPLQNKKLRERGFNQSELLADVISKQIGVPIAKQSLLKIKNTPSQTTLTEDKRRLNIKGVFNVKNIELIKNKKIILIDDVATTGATLEEAAKILKKAGAKLVWGLVLARG